MLLIAGEIPKYFIQKKGKVIIAKQFLSLFLSPSICFSIPLKIYHIISSYFLLIHKHYPKTIFISITSNNQQTTFAFLQFTPPFNEAARR